MPKFLISALLLLICTLCFTSRTSVPQDQSTNSTTTSSSRTYSK